MTVISARWWSTFDHQNFLRNLWTTVPLKVSLSENEISGHALLAYIYHPSSGRYEVYLGPTEKFGKDDF